MTTRRRLMLAFGGAQLALTALIAAATWLASDALLRREAEASATAAAGVVARGGFATTPEVLERMSALAGRGIRLGGEPPPGWVAATVAGRTVLVEYRTPQQLATQRRLLWTVLALAGGSTLGFALLAWWLAGRFAGPIERAARLATLGTFAASVAHEVRNPLASLRLAVDVAAAGRDDPAMARMVDEIARLELVVDGLTGYARGFTADPVACDLHAEADAVIALLSRQARHAGVALERTGAARAQADPLRLRQLLLNLVVNAIQACQEGRGTRVVVAVSGDGLAVSDDGPGVAPGIAAALFQPFASGRREGIGLGLHICREIARAHGATLYLEPAARGACFRLSGLRPATAARLPGG